MPPDQVAQELVPSRPEKPQGWKATTSLDNLLQGFTTFLGVLFPLLSNQNLPCRKLLTLVLWDSCTVLTLAPLRRVWVHLLYSPQEGQDDSDFLPQSPEEAWLLQPLLVHPTADHPGSQPVHGPAPLHPSGRTLAWWAKQTFCLKSLSHTNIITSEGRHTLWSRVIKISLPNSYLASIEKWTGIQCCWTPLTCSIFAQLGFFTRPPSIVVSYYVP